MALRSVALAVVAFQGDAGRQGEAPAYPPRLERLERIVLGEILPALRQGLPCRRTVAGLLLAAGGGRLTLTRRLRGARRAAFDLTSGRPAGLRCRRRGRLLGKPRAGAYIAIRVPVPNPSTPARYRAPQGLTLR